VQLRLRHGLSLCWKLARVTGVIVDQSGQALAAGIVVDCTGDGDMARAGRRAIRGSAATTVCL
jgi:hypothetical protein